jgi:hypothetical protein
MKTTLIVLGGAWLASTLLAAPSARAAKPLDAKQKLELARDMANNKQAKAKALSPPKNTEQALAASRRKLAKDSYASFELGEDTYNYLGAAQDANGVMHVRDVNPNAPVVKLEVVDEK